MVFFRLSQICGRLTRVDSGAIRAKEDGKRGYSDLPGGWRVGG